MLAFVILNTNLEAINIVDYMRVDYPLALRDSLEWQEMLQFSARLREILKGKQRAFADTLYALVKGKAHPDSIAPYLERIREFLMSDDLLKPYPEDYPDLGGGKSLYTIHCSSCHGERGDGRGKVSGLEPPPANFMERDDLTPFRIFTVLHFGAAGMPSFRNMDDMDKWNVAFYVMALRHGEESDSDTLYLPLRIQSVVSDSHLLYLGYSEGQVAFLRRHPVASDTIALISSTLDYIIRLVKYRGDYDAAYGTSVHLYVNYLEPMEHRIANKSRVEMGFLRLRDALERRKDAGAVEAIVSDIRPAIEREDFNSSIHTVLSSFVILFREGLEAILLIAIMLSVAVRYSRRLVLPIHAGWMSAIAAGLITYIFMNGLLNNMNLVSELIEGVTSIIASIIMIYVSLWFTGRDFVEKFRGNVSSLAGRGASAGVFLLSFTVVYREVFETVLFYTALLNSSPSAGGVIPGIVLALVVLTFISYIIFVLQRRLPLNRIFSITSAVLLIMAFVFIGKGVKELQEAGVFPARFIDFVPHIELLGIYPTLESLIAQGFVIFVVLAILLRRRVMRIGT